ncbi:hypothetical protein LAZ67_7002153 [Cordylochernes scorpioides]|uniref:PiggyBac transposable element-derived protein domain-containing protein n=1 Tax=Cordylochernes scorpioides TaxID=51811 RepID=A0ABY6KMU4_9ARAC|nr:hypothetical protein LAZ67_7002153 [Cordylochernes scorpioides]
MYSVGRRTKRWPLCLFFNFLDVVTINSVVIYKAAKQDGGMARKDFIKQLALQLMRDALNMRNQAKNLSRDLQVLIQKHAGTSSLEVRLFIFEILFIMEDEILNKNFDDDSETENYSLNESSDVSTDEECDSILTTVQMSSSNCFIGKNGYKWNKNHAIIGRTRSHNIITHLPGLKGPAKPKPNCSIDIFNLFFTAAIIKQISEFTNAKIEEFRQRISDLTKSTYSNFTSEIEIRAFLGLLYLAGVYKSGHENVESLFASDGTGRDIFRSVMSVKRFLFLLLCIRFDNFKTRCKVDRLLPIRDIFQTIIEKFQSCYTPAEYLTVDKMLVGFRGKCPFKIYIPSKPNKYGIKIVILADSRTHYMYNAMVYTGKSKTPKSKELSLPTQIVLDISRPLWKSNRNITADNWFTSIELVDKLKEHGLTYLGTMRKNKPQIPPQFQPHPKRESGTSIFGFSGTKTLVSYVPKKRKSVILISSMHHDNKCDKTTGKPDIIMDYNLTKGSVDTIDQMVSNFSTSCRSRRWPLALFYALLDITALNSYIIFNYQIDKKDQKERSTFIVDLGRSLIDEHLATRNLNSLPLELQTTIKKFKNNDGSSTSRGSTMPQESDTPKRCYKCPSKNAGKVKTLCSVHKWVESTHPVQLRKKKSPVQLRVKLPKTTIYRVKKQFDEADSNKEGIATRKKHSHRSDRVSGEEFVKNVKEKIDGNPGKSMRAIAKEMDVGSMTIVRTIHEDLGLKSYALRKGQLLTENMKNNRKGKAAALLNNLKHDSFGMLRFFSDEKNFDVDQKVNPRNDRWICKDPSEIPVVMHTKFPASVMVLGVISSEGDVMPPHFFEKGLRMNADTYINVLETVVKPWMDMVAAGRKYVFQQDSAPAHKAKKTQSWLTLNVPSHWGPDIWPPNSPDCNPLDYYVWGVVERDVNKAPHTTIQSVKKAVHTVMTQMDKVIVAKACASFRTRLETVVANNGNFIE